MAGSGARLIRSRGFRRGLLLCGATLLVLGGWLAVRLVRVAGDLRDARDHLHRAGELLEDQQISGARDELAAATSLLVDSNGELYRGADIALLGPLPGVSQNLSALRESIALALRIADGGRRTLEAAAPLESAEGDLEVPLADGAIPLDAVAEAQVELEALLGAMPARMPEDSPFLVGPVKDVRREVYEEALGRRGQVSVLSRGLGLLSDMAGASGPRRYLIAVANTAEMRGSGGMILNYGVLEGQDGDFELPAFGRIDELLLNAPIDAASVPAVPADYLRRWSGFDPLQRWRNANLAGDFTLIAPALEAMYTQATGLDVDGVIQVDPAGLAAILAGTGPIEVPEVGQVTADNVVSLVLNDAYFRFPGIEERSDVLEDVAEATFDRLVTGSYDSLRPLAEAVVAAVDGRHILFHASAVTAQARVRAFGATGELPDPAAPDSVHLTVQNLAGNKLDYYLDTALAISGERPAESFGDLTGTITLRNIAPPGATQPRYVFGPFDDSSPPAGTIRSVVTLYVPVGTTVTATSGDATVEQVTTGTEGGRPFVSYIADVAAGTSHTIELSLRLAPRPSGRYHLDLVPAPRVRPTQVSVAIDTGDGEATGDVVLDRTWRIEAGREPTPVVAPVYR